MPRASTHIFRVRLWPKVYRDIEIDSRKSLYDPAAAIVRALGSILTTPSASSAS